ncbi:TraA family conjugative transfer protein [uncultured Umboniibacter sp.]|uniref:TraA family conjugative transfer protein n=1 Tax=uncultured Umboniibacter sp. TaxID=1798917 RepID=UPI00260224BA|nr:TraA family conjugative transfer protein [uncultured Umboniibacter sp.]
MLNKKNVTLAVASGLTLAAAGAAVAGGSADTTFDSVYTQLKDWLNGSLGKVLAGAFVLVGVIAGVARQSLMGFAVGVGAGVGLFNIGTIIDSLFTATLAHAPAATEAVQMLNGLN